MAVAVKNASETAPPRPLDRLAVGSLVGVVYVLGSIGIVFYGLPTLWAQNVSPAIVSGMGTFVNAGLLLLAVVAAAIGLAVLGMRLVGPKPPHGLSAGIGLGILALAAVVLITWIVGAILEAVLPANLAMVGALVTAAAFVGQLIYVVRAYFRPKADEFLAQVEDQGWFGRNVYKGSQGQMVRRGTLVAILIIGGCGIYSLLSHNTLGTFASAVTGGANDWVLVIPFTGGHYIPLLRDVRFTAPIVLTALTLWIAFRAINYPAFADFLIATEAEMNKVSWTTRHRLYQDTIVVLATLFLFTVFLMVVDLAWGWLLSHRWVGVIQVEQTTSKSKDEVQKW